jgi:hypothetical protein
MDRGFYLVKKIKERFKENFPNATRRDIFVWFFIILSASFAGLVITLFNFREALDLGDGSTFFQFAHNLAQGEVIYKDFIHFRTPGSYFLQAFSINVFGDQQSSVRFALGFESRVLYTLFFGLALAIFLRFKHVIVGATTLLLIIALPAYAQLRTALAFLAVVLYIHSLRFIGARQHKGWLLASGVFVGLAFTFGQEAALMAIVVIGLVEAARIKLGDIGSTLKRIGVLALGFTAGVLPLLLYVLILSDVGTFAYYVIYYAFVLQPQGMDLIYPSLEYGNSIFYIVFALYLIIFCIFYSNQKMMFAEGALLMFGIMRLVTLLGRSDLGHLMFILPELFFLSLFALVKIKTAIFNWRSLVSFLPYGAALSVAFYLAIRGSSILIILSAAVVIIAFRVRRTLLLRESRSNESIVLAVNTALVSMIAILLFLVYPYYSSTIQGMSTRGLTNTQLGGVNVDGPVYSEVKAVEGIVGSLHPSTIFSYPIQPYYYSLAPHHATRLLTFEPQTTDREQASTIKELQKTRPEVIIYDPVQADSLLKPLGKINQYIQSEYKVIRTVQYTKTLWIMVRKDS